MKEVKENCLAKVLSICLECMILIYRYRFWANPRYEYCSKSMTHLFFNLLTVYSQVFKEAAMFRWRLKDLCDKVFLRYYEDELGMNAEIEGQVHYTENIADWVQQLIGRHSLWHYGPEDAHVRLNSQSFPLLNSNWKCWIQGKKLNLEHPGIAALCIEFYYGSASGKIPLAKLFPDDFSKIIPDHAVVAVVTCVGFSPLPGLLHSPLRNHH